jgi:hypothetical protein
MKRSIVMAVFLLGLASIAQADTLVNVVFQPVTFFQSPPFETIGVSFTWDTTTQILSNFVITSVGPVTGFSPSFVIFDSSEIEKLSFSNGKGESFQLEYSFHGDILQPELSSTPGTYPIDVNLFCNGDPHVCGGFYTDTGHTATVTAVATPEPGTLALVGVGLVGGSLARKRKKSAILREAQLNLEG